MIFAGSFCWHIINRWNSGVTGHLNDWIKTLQTIGIIIKTLLDLSLIIIFGLSNRKIWNFLNTQKQLRGNELTMALKGTLAMLAWVGDTAVLTVALWWSYKPEVNPKETVDAAIIFA